MNSLEINRSIIALSQIKGLGRKKIGRILEEISDFNHASFMELIEIGIRLNLLSKMSPIGEFLNARIAANNILAICEHNDIQVASIYAEDFPDVLKFKEGPHLIYYKGNISALSLPKRAAVIGTRAPSEKGSAFARWAGKQLAEKDYVVISGLASGCDRAAHLGCLDAGGTTVAFLPSSILNITPKENIGLAKRIVETGGCLVSEYSSYDIANAGMFIERDRLQAAASNFVITSEFEENSGTLHTLEFANQYEKTIVSTRCIQESGITGFDALQKEHIPYRLLSEAEIINYLDEA